MAMNIIMMGGRSLDSGLNTTSAASTPHLPLSSTASNGNRPGEEIFRYYMVLSYEYKELRAGS
jgi:hypothetical protein